MTDPTPFTPNGSDQLATASTEVTWPEVPTAMLVVHGIGNQLPLETLDQFGRGLIQVYQQEFGESLIVSHHLVDKEDTRGGLWFDNVLRLSRQGKPGFIDLYEYYWAYYSEDKATWRDINGWIQGVVKGARHFYQRNASLGQQYKDKSLFFHSRTGEFSSFRYNLFVSFASKVLLGLDALWRGFLWLITRIPFLGSLADALIRSYADNAVRGLTNVIGDVVVYNVNDPKSKFYDVKKRIKEGAVKSLKYLIEREDSNEKNLPYYPRVVVAGHSLGSQVAYDAINRMNLLVNQGEVNGYRKDGTHKTTGAKLEKQLCGFVTFGSPLDKIMFFLRENVPDEQYLRQQFLDHFNGFKQRDINFGNSNRGNPNYVKTNSSLQRHLENIPWRNYYDGYDYVSGGLDYYHNLTNIDCRFKPSGFIKFTHSDYWTHPPFYRDIIRHFIQ